MALHGAASGVETAVLIYSDERKDYYEVLSARHNTDRISIKYPCRVILLFRETEVWVFFRKTS
jgi:hypothetical protein